MKTEPVPVQPQQIVRMKERVPNNDLGYRSGIGERRAADLMNSLGIADTDLLCLGDPWGLS
jgi:hypothetical protein